MPPKKSTSVTDPAIANATANAAASATPDRVPTTFEDLAALTANIAKRLSAIEVLLTASKAENAKLAKELTESRAEAASLRDQVNNLEQHGRGWSVRVMGLQLPEDEESIPERVMHHLHEKLLKPILEGAVARGLLQSVPPANAVLETAHVLPAREGATRPIIARFYTRNLRALVFKLKREFAPREQRSRADPNTNQRGPKFIYSIYDDLTRANFAMLKKLSNDSRVQSCWSANGQIKYKLVGDQATKKVKSAFDDIENFIK